MTTKESKTHLATRLPPNMVWIYVEAKKKGYTEAEFLREGARLFAEYRLNPENSKIERDNDAKNIYKGSIRDSEKRQVLC